MSTEPPATASVELPAPTSAKSVALRSKQRVDPTSTKHVAPLSLELSTALFISGDGRSYHRRLQQFENTLGPAVLREKVRGYEKEFVSMIAEDARLRETISVKEKHVMRLQNLLHTWSATTPAERREFGDYYTEEDVKETLQRQTQTMAELRSTLNCLKYEVETVRLRISLTWEMIELVEKSEEGLVGRGKNLFMTAGGSHDTNMQVDN